MNMAVSRAAERLSRPLLRMIVGGFQQARRAIWYFTRPETFGAHALPLTRRGTVVLVKLRYAPGWRLPGGGRRKGEPPQDAALRELREEIGMTAHGSVRLAAEYRETPDFKRDTSTLFIVRDVEYRPRWSIEIEEVMEAALDGLPPDMSPRSLRWIATARRMLDDPPPR